MKQILYYMKQERHFMQKQEDGTKAMKLGKFPITTVTVFQNELGQCSRGVAICSRDDQFVRREGRDLSNDRCAKSYRKEQSFGEINRKNLFIDEKFKFKCEWQPELTDYEKHLLEDPKVKG